MEEGGGDQEKVRDQPEPLFTPFRESTLQLEGAKIPNPKYREGNVLPKQMLAKFLKEAKPCVPLEEIDPYYRNRRTFVAIGQRGYIHRFSPSVGNYLTLNPNSAVRKWAIYLYTNWMFSAFIVATILVNIYALITTQSGYIMRALTNNYEQNRTLDAFQAVDYICLAVYCFELVVKLLARGLFAGEFTAGRSPWVWLDGIVILTGFTQPSSLFWLHRGASSWIRIFKLIPLIPSVRHAFRLSIQAVKRLAGMLPLLCLLLWLFSLIGTQVYMGTLTQKCIKQFPEGMEISDEIWTEHNQNTENWEFYTEYPICGNASGSRPCPEGYVCLQGFGSNPDNDFTKFDDIFWSLISVLRIAGEDFTEEILRQLVAANGPLQINFFVAIFFFITLPMGCLFFCILANLFVEKWEEKEACEEMNDSCIEQNSETAAAAATATETNGKHVDDDNANKDDDSELNGFRKNLHSIVHDGWMATLVLCVIYIDNFVIASYYYGIEENNVDYRLYTQIIPYIVFVVYLIEFLVKVIASGPGMYFRDAWNSLDLLILFQFSLQFVNQFGHLFASIRLLKLVKYWPSLKLILGIYAKTLSVLKGWILYACIVMGFIVLIGPLQLGRSEWGRVKPVNVSVDPTSIDMPRWTFIDFWHSFRMVVRMQIAEWIETLWEVLPFTSNAFYYYLAANIFGALFLSYVLVAIVFLTMRELQDNNDPFKERGIRRFINRALSHIPGIKSQEVHLQNGFETLPISTNNAADKTDEKLIVVGKDEESTGHLRKKMQRFTEHWAYKTVCLGVILFGSFSMTLLHDVHADWKNGMYIAMLTIEILFTGSFVIIVVFELVAFGFKESVLNCSWLFDTLIVVENIVNVCAHFKFLINISGPFGVGAFCIRCFRPLMLISRVKKLKTTFRMIKFELKQIWELILAIFFIWLLFDTFAVHWLNGLYHRCLDPPTGEEVSLDKISCLAGNLTWANSNSNFDDSSHGFLNMVFLVSRMGWISIINDAADATDLDMARIKDNSKMWLIYFILFVLSGGLGALGVLFSHVLNMFLQDKGCTVILTDYQADIYNERKRQKEKEQSPGVALEEERIPVPSSSLCRSLYKLVTNWKFDAFIMLIIILDNITISLDSYRQSVTWDVVLGSLHLVYLIIYIAEAIVKIVAWGKDYFRSGWNIFDFLVVVTGIAGIILSDLVEMYFISPALLRVFRLLRIFRFLLSKKWGLTTAKVLISAASNVRHAFGNLILFQLTVMWAFSVLGMSLFEHVRQTGGLDWLLNFSSFGSAFTVMILLLGFPCLDGFYVGLSNEEDCEVGGDGDIGNCGNRTAAVVYLGLYAGITFIVMLNMYAVLIAEIMSEFTRLKEKATKEEAGEGICLQDVVTEKADDEEAVNEKIDPQETA